MSHWEMYCLMELMNKNMKELDLPNTIKGWQSYSQNVMLCQRSRVFVMNKYSNHRSDNSHNNKYSTIDEYTDLSYKGNVRYKSIPCRRTSEMVMCTKLFSLADVFINKPNRKFDKTILWSLLSLLATKLADPEPISSDSNSSSSIHNLSRSIFGLSKEKINNTGEVKKTTIWIH